ncbi:MAG TPA: SdiA-regulated domain-containing protein [Verrucomicrobiae bacterium]|nr:SdiA-regulated domain-containing protein [Verrucomicrobiae bacterium]
MKKLSVAHLRSLPITQIAAVLLLASPVSSQAANSIALDYPIEYANDNYYSGTPQSLGSGVTYWPSRNSYLLLDNTVPARLVEYHRDNSPWREIGLVNFKDPEDIHWISGNTFVISQEFNNNGSSNELVVVTLPTGDVNTSLDINDRQCADGACVVRRLSFPTNLLGTVHNKGIEGVALIGNTFYFATEYPPLAPATWKVWTVPNSGDGQVTPTAAFNLPLPGGNMHDISGMASDGTYLWLLSHEGSGSEASPVASITKATTGGSVIAVYSLPNFASGIWWQAEGIELFANGPDPRKILLTGEHGNGIGVDFMLLTEKGVKLATYGVGSEGWRFYPFLNGGGSQLYYSTTSFIETNGLTAPAPEAVYQRVQPEFATLIVSNLIPTTTYRVRIHLASVEFPGWENVLQNVWVSNGGSPNFVSGVTPYGPQGFNHAMIVDLGTMQPYYPPYAQGKFWVGIDPAAPGYGVVVNGIEIWQSP